MEKHVKTAILLDLYGALLTDKQAQALDLYYNEDLSLSEIAENTHVTRQAVHDAIAKGERTLWELEEKTHLSERLSHLEERLKAIHRLAREGYQTAHEAILSLSEIGEYYGI